MKNTKRCGRRKAAEKKTNLNKKKRKRERERKKSQRNQKSDNGARGKTFRLAGASQRIRQAREYKGGRRRRGRRRTRKEDSEEKIEVGVEKKA